MDEIYVGSEVVGIDSLEPYPGNARRGDVRMIADSLAKHGQFKPIVVNRRNRQILAGNHTWKAARSLGWKEIGVTWVDVDDAGAARIVLADNRTSDLASYDDASLLRLIGRLSDLDGTGFTMEDVYELENLFANDGDDTPGPGPWPDEPDDVKDVKFQVGPFRWQVEADAYDAWFGWVTADAGDDKKARIERVCDLMGMPVPERRKRQKSDPADTPVTLSALAPELVDLSMLVPLDGNAREGDVGAICESLVMNGQYRPVVARRQDGMVLIGNHTTQAARMLGWEQVAVIWLDVDDETAIKIALADNRTADVAGYDPQALRDLLLEIDGDFVGTAWGADEVDEFLAGGSARPGPARSARVRVDLGEIRFQADKDVFWPWARKLPTPTEPYLAGLLQLPDESCKFWSGGI